MNLNKKLTNRFLLAVPLVVLLLPVLYSVGQTLGVFVSTELVKLLQHLM